MDKAILHELKEEISRLKLGTCTKEEILELVEKLLHLSERLLSRVHAVERKLEILEKQQEQLSQENNKLVANMDKVIALAYENPGAAIAILLQLAIEGKNPGTIN